MSRESPSLRSKKQLTSSLRRRNVFSPLFLTFIFIFSSLGCSGFALQSLTWFSPFEHGRIVMSLTYSTRDSGPDSGVDRIPIDIAPMGNGGIRTALRVDLEKDPHEQPYLHASLLSRPPLRSRTMPLLTHLSRLRRIAGTPTSPSAVRLRTTKSSRSNASTGLAARSRTTTLRMMSRMSI